MAQVRFTNHLKRFFPTLINGQVVEGSTIAEIVATLDERYPGMGSYLVDERGVLRKHVNIFIGDTRISDHEHLQDPVSADSQIFIFQALSGG
jgi:hypothetical protein